MKIHEPSDLQWVGIDLHVHTPASADWKGPRDDSEYLNLIRRANELGITEQAGAKSKRDRQDRRPIGCIAFTDHNSVEGFRKLRALQDETRGLRDSLRLRDPGNPYLSQLEKDLETLGSIRVLMGSEIKVYPGIHLLLIFHESVEAELVIGFLEKAYDRPYREFAGDAGPVSAWTVEEALNRIRDSFGDKVIVVAPHVDSTGGLYEGLKDYPQVRMAALKHPIVRALSFNRLETRDRIRELYKQPDYRRPDQVALVQSSDFHGEPGTVVGQLRTEVSLPNGKATFNNIKTAFGDPARVKCSVDFTREEYEQLTSDRFVARFSSVAGDLRFQDADYDAVASAVCGMLNSGGGVLELEGTVNPSEAREAYWTRVRDQLKSILETRLQPTVASFPYRDFRFSPGRIRILVRINAADRLYTAHERPMTVKNGGVHVASSADLEAIVSRNISARFGSRFERTLETVSTESILLSKMPRGISILLACQEKLKFGLKDVVETKRIDSASKKGTDVAELVHDLWHRGTDEFPFGCPEGNASILWGMQPPRHEEHYRRLTVPRLHVDADTLSKCASEEVARRAIVVYFGGGVGVLEPGYVISEVPALLLEPVQDWEEQIYSLAGWLKSSFFLWYCAVCLGDPDLYLQLQFETRRLPLPKKDNVELYRRLDGLLRNLVLDEEKFMDEINREKKRGTLGSAEQEKARTRHNTSANRMCLHLDKEIFRFLGLSDEECRFIARTLRDIRMTDFGFLEELEAEP